MDEQQPSVTPGGINYVPQIKYWVDHYAAAGVDDRRSVQTFIDCETRELQVRLRNELRSVSGGHILQTTLERLVGKQRALRHGSYEAWAKFMLVAMAEYKG